MSGGIHIYALLVIWYQVVLVVVVSDTSNSWNDEDDTGEIASSTSLLLPMASVILFYMVYLPVTLLALVSLIQATCTNPGAVPMGARPFVTVRRVHAAPPLSSSSSSMSNNNNNNNNNNNTDTSSITTLGDPGDGGVHEPNDSIDGTTPNTAGATAKSTSSTHHRTTTTTPDPASIRRCEACGDNYKPARAHHDRVTGRCIVKFDHYCPWINNAVGVLNHKFFCLFLFYTALSCIASLLLLLLHYIHCVPYYHRNPNHHEDHPMDSTTTSSSMEDTTIHVNDNNYSRNSVGNGHPNLLLTLLDTTAGDGHHTRFLRGVLSSSSTEEILLTTTATANGWNANHSVCQDFFQQYTIMALLMMSVIFLVFTVIMMLDQLDTIRTGKGKIARLKQRVGASGSTELERVTQEFNEMFGGTTPNVAWHWFVPIAVRYPNKMKHVVLGYEFNPTCHPCVPYGMETTTPSPVDTTCLVGCDANDDDADAGEEESLTSSRSSVVVAVGDALAKSRPTTAPPLPHGGLFHPQHRESSSSSSSSESRNHLHHSTSLLNHRRGRNGSGGDPDGSLEGITLVERARTRIS